MMKETAPAAAPLTSGHLRLPIRATLGAKREGEKMLVGFIQPNGVVVVLEFDESILNIVIGSLLKGRSAFGEPAAIGVASEGAMPVASMSMGREMNGDLFLRPHFQGGGHLGLTIPTDVEDGLVRYLNP
ncbi:hypothetical protein [Hyphomicrobium sp. 2TAF46]|uniref:hypothetical protein n=1 Tax=Hyphomicrobium sp. 2TAF46 TaxID=3233019 RepID=UPI003F8F3BBE